MFIVQWVKDMVQFNHICNGTAIALVLLKPVVALPEYVYQMNLTISKKLSVVLRFNYLLSIV